jgi:hypothetical protein
MGLKKENDKCRKTVAAENIEMCTIKKKKFILGLQNNK